MERERPKHGKHTQATATMTMMKTTYSLSTILILLLHTISTYAQTESENVVLENLGTFRSNQTTWTVAWREPATPTISKYGVYYHMTSDAADSAVKVDEIVSRGPKYFYKVPISHLVPNTNYTVIIQPCGETSCYANITYNGRTTPCCGRSQLQVHITYPGMSCAQQGILQTKIRSHIAYPLQARWRQGFCGRSCDQTNRLLLNRCPMNAVLANITFPYAREEFQLYDPASGGASAKMSSIDAIRYDLVTNKAFDFSSDSTLIGGKPDIDNVIIMKTYTGCGATAPMMDTCIGCGPGYYVVGAPHKRLGCLACEKGSYQPENHKRHCIPCPADAKGRSATTLHTASKQEAQCFFSAAVDGVSPAYGPKAGGTVVKIAMVYFKADQLKSVTVAGSPCAVVPGSVSDLGLDCKTSAVNRLSSGPVIVDLGETQVASDTVFHYKNNPDIDSVDFLNTFISGGVVLTVHGSFMDAVAEPIMQITRKIKEHKEIYSVVCVVNDEFSFSCETPNMTQGFENLSDIKLPSADSVRNRTRKSRSLHTYSEPNNAHDLTRRSQVTNVNFTQSLDKLDPRIKFAISGFVLDGVSTYSNFTAVKAQYSRLAVYADPIIYKFPGEQYLRVFKTGRQDLLQIEGERLNLGCRPEDYRVQIGLANCTVSVLTTRLLGCKPPFEKPESDPSVYWQDYPHVQVQVGRLSFLAGYVEYQLITCKLGVFCDIKVAGAVIGLAALFLTIVAVACVCTLKRRRRPRSRPKRDNSQPPALGTGEVHYRPDTLPKDRDNNYSPLRTRRDKGRLVVLKAIALLHLFLPIAAGAAITCASSPCKNRASCVEDFKGGGFRCSCLPGYTGGLCEIKLTPILRNVLTTSINQTAWTFSWNEPSTPALSRYWYTVAKQVPGGGTTQVVPRREFASKGPGTFVQIMVVGLRPRNTYTVTIIPCSDSLCYIPSALTATTLAACGLGRFSNVTSGSCQACPRGFYQSEENDVKTSCSVCPSDNKARRGTTLTTASKSIQDCYFAPSVDVLFPAYGPVAGGTVLLFRMAYFDLCERVSVRVGGAVCLNAAKTKEGVICETSEVNKAGKAVANITCQHTNKVVHYASAEFEYKPDPIIHSTGTNKTFIRGGISINVAGEHLRSAYKITMETMRVISNEAVKFVSPPCEVQSDDLMYCRTADMSANFEVKTGIKLPAKPPNQLARMVARSPGRSGRVKRSTTTSQSIEELNSTISFYISAFHMDGVDTYKDFRKTHPQHSSLAVYFDPEILVFSEQDNIKEYTSGNLRIDGSRLQWQVRDFDISIGKEKCPLKEVYHNAIYCNPPSNPPEISLDHPQKQGLPHVMVKVGFLRYSVGFLRYADTCTLGVFCDTLVIVGVALLGVFFLLVITVAWCCSARRRRRRRERKREERAQELRRISQNLNKGEPHNLQMRSLPHPQRTYQDPASPRGVATMPAGNADGSRGFWEDLDDNNLKATLKDCLIAPRRLELGEGIGEGHFGKVYKGKLLDRDFSSHKIVAVKTIQGKRFTQKEFKSFLSEAVIMKDFDHINVLSLYGVVIKEDKPYVILPYMEHGDLKSFIINPAQPLTVRELLQFGYQIAQGMSYLARKKFVHRDLATRNCMVNKALTIKIADFGLSRDIHRKDYYAAQDKERPLPVKWMAPESLETGIFTAKTDVWAFGVVLWELMTRGCTPYPDVGNMDIKRYLQNGRRMTKPGHAPDAVYQIMLLCWDKDPKTRPDFAQLVRRLQAILNDKTTGGGDYLSPVTSTYYIQPVSD